MNAIQFLAGMGAGYLDRQDKERALARQQKYDDIAFEEAQAQRDARNRALSDDAALRAAGAPVPVESGELYQPAVDDEGNVMPANPTAGTFKVGANRFASRGIAEQAARDQQRTNIADALTRQGKPVAADQLRASGDQQKEAELRLKAALKHAQDEGTGKALSMALALGPGGAEQVKQAYNAAGGEQIGDLQITPIDVNHPVLGPSKSVRIVGKTTDGRTFEIPDALDASFRLFSAEKQFDLGMKAKDDARQDKAEKRLDESAKALERYHNALADAALGRADAAITKAEGAGQGKNAFERMSEVDKEEYKGLKDRIKTMEGEIVKAQAAGTWDDASPNAKALKTQKAALELKASQLLKRYGDDSAAPDPLGIRAANRITPEQQAARDAEGGLQRIRAEFGGNVDTAQAALAKLDAAAAAEKNAETKQIIQSDADRLRAGIVAAKAARPTSANIAANVGVRPPVVPAVTPASAIAPTPASVLPRPTADVALNRIQADSIAAMQPLNEAVAQARTQLAAAAKSGDPVALQRYATNLTMAVEARNRAAAERFGNRAPQYLATLPQ